jgi:opacity protein-like surface antigen
MRFVAVTAASVLLFVGTAHAQMARSGMGGTAGTAYGELGYTQLKISESGLSVKPGMLRGILGYNFGENLALEGMLGFGVRKDNANGVFTGVPVNIEGDVRHMVGIYVKPKVVLGNAFELFGRLGYTDTRLRTTASVAGFRGSETSSGSDWSYGLGGNFNIAPRAYVGLDYMRYYKKNDVKLDGVTVSVGYRF